MNNSPTQRGVLDLASSRNRRPAARRSPRRLAPIIEGLENRALLSNVTWTNANGGDWDTGTNWSTGQVPGPNDNVTISLNSAETITLSSSKNDSVLSLNTNGSTTLKIVNGSLSIGAGNSTLGGPVLVNSGATLGVGAGASLLIESTLTDNGTLTFASGDTVTLGNTQIVVGGTMTAASDSFATNNGNYFTGIQVNAGGHLKATGSSFTLSQLSLDNSSVLNSGDLTGDTFNMPIYVPYNDVQFLGNNAGFNDIEINAGTLSSGTLSLNRIGTNPANLRYVFSSGFTVASGATVNVGANVSALIQSQPFTDNGTLTFASGDTVTLGNTQIVVGGTMTATSDSFATNNGNYFTGIQVNAGGHLKATGSSFTLSQLSLNNSSVLNSGDLTNDTFNMPVYVPYNDVQFLGNNAGFNDIEINAGTLSSGTLSLNRIGTNPANLPYVFSSGFTVASGATVNVGANVSALIQSQPFTDNGTLTFASGDTVTLGNTQIVVGGTMTAASDSFATNNGNYFTGIQVNAGGHLKATGSSFTLSQLSLDNSSVLNSGDLTGDTFNMPIYVPYNDVQFLGNNAGFNDIEINAGTLSSGTLSLNRIGTNPANLRYVFSSGFTVASGATVNVGANVSALIQSQPFTDNGTLTFASGDTVTLGNTQIVVGGTMTATSDSFATNNGNYFTGIQVNAGGRLEAAGSSFTLSQLFMNNSSVLNSGDLTNDTFNMPIYVPYNDVQFLGNNAGFNDIEINAGTLSSGTLSLNRIGTNPANLRYVFSSGFTVASGPHSLWGPMSAP